MRFKLLMLSLLLVGVVVRGPAYAEKRCSNANGMFLGRGIFGCSKHINLDIGRPPKLAATLNKKDKNFEKTLRWIDLNIYGQMLFPEALSNQKPEGWLRLYAIELPTDDQTKVLPSLLVEIPLTKEILGADCLAKMEQLKHVMNDD